MDAVTISASHKESEDGWHGEMRMRGRMKKKNKQCQAWFSPATDARHPVAVTGCAPHIQWIARLSGSVRLAPSPSSRPPSLACICHTSRGQRRRRRARFGQCLRGVPCWRRPRRPRRLRGPATAADLRRCCFSGRGGFRGPWRPPRPRPSQRTPARTPAGPMATRGSRAGAPSVGRGYLPRGRPRCRLWRGRNRCRST